MISKTIIWVTCIDNKIIYNAYHLIKAFYPDSMVKSGINEEQEKRIIVDITENVGLNKAFGKADTSANDRCRTENSVRLSADSIRELYEILRERTGIDLPWGMLTGVRPVKLATAWIQENLNCHSKLLGMCSDEDLRARDAFAEWFYRERFVSQNKAYLAFDVAMKEQEITRKAGNGYSLYIGIPFCPTVCSYCSFSSGEIGTYEKQVDSYLRALTKELRQRSNECEGFPGTVYIGGGTPTSITVDQLNYLLEETEQIFNIRNGLLNGKILEYTVEAGRPDSITKDKLRIIKDHHVTRISINPQSMQQKTLDRIGRRHSVEEVKEAFYLARDMGFDNINMDIIMGLPGENITDVKDTLSQIRKLQPDSLTVHSLAVKRASRIGIARKTGESNDAQIGGSSEIAEMIDAAYKCALSMGMNPYYLYRQKSIAGNFENIGYAVSGKEGIYNVLIMEEVQSIIACGAGASSKIVTQTQVPNPKRHGQLTRMLRSENVKNIDAYIEGMQKQN